jgi:outer membrane protein
MSFVSTAALLGLTLIAGPALAQTTQTPPKPQTATPPATQTPPQAPKPPAAPPAAATQQPPVPMPEGAKFGFFSLQAVADQSALGKAGSAQVKTLTDKKAAEITSKQTQLQALQQKRQTSASVMTAAAVSQMDKDIERLNLDIQYMQQTAQKEVEDLNNDLMNEFYQKIVPVLETIAKEKGLHAIFSAQDAGAIYIHPGLDMTSEIVKKLDATYKK